MNRLSLKDIYALKCLIIKLQFFEFGSKYRDMEKNFDFDTYEKSYDEYSDWVNDVESYYKEFSTIELIEFHKKMNNDEQFIMECLEISNEFINNKALSSSNIRKDFVQYMKKEQRNIKLNSILNYD